ncbi:hypothetical protein HRG_006492 [Hirsutella rhossiliensis]|uniref:Uncharacterized protein n=1 Tax=Hirsutella rhossiliensis TaxID=111463 RepID=A0A9P8SI98_9HYPO|nr:uncharacterized protein HRG_06492 [Hirsutella rhossiliensis]KAH0962390.1 hypothetical protein HRG_06492 [Hirsutella rhossiliensis]
MRFITNLLLAGVLASPILSTAIPDMGEAVDLVDRDVSSAEGDGNNLFARKVRLPCRVHVPRGSKVTQCAETCSQDSLGPS